MSSVRFLHITTLGGVVLVAIMAGRAAGVPTLVLMLAAGIALPLGFSVALETKAEAHPLPRRALARAAPFGAAAGVLGWLAPPGHLFAVVTALVHALVCMLAGALAAARLLHRRAERGGPLHELAIDVGLALLPVGGIWLVAARAGASFMGFQEPVVTFTAIHFHFAGFAAPTIIGGVGRLFAADPPKARAVRSLYRIAAVAVCAGVPLTAIGIVTNTTVEAIAAVALASGMLCASTLLVFAASRQAARYSKIAAGLFVISGATLLLTMTLAATFALTSSAGRGSALDGGAIRLQTMIDWHGGANAIGFSLAGLGALALVSREAKRRARRS